LKELGDVELPDATLTEAEKLALREKIRAVAVGRSVQACMFAAGSWENEARAKQDEGRRSMAS